MRISIIQNNGKIIQIVNVPSKQIAFTPPDGTYAIGLAPPDLNHYWSGSEFISLGEAPSPKSYFDYDLKDWVDPRSLDDIKAEHWTDIKRQRDELDFGGFEFSGHMYDSDQKSQGRVLMAAISGLSQTWIDKSNEAIDLTPEQMEALKTAMHLHIQSTHEKGRIAKALIFKAETIEDVLAVKL